MITVRLMSMSLDTAVEAVFHLNCPKGPVALRENYFFGRRDIARIKAMLSTRLAQLCKDWEKIHGKT